MANKSLQPEEQLPAQEEDAPQTPEEENPDGEKTDEAKAKRKRKVLIFVLALLVLAALMLPLLFVSYDDVRDVFIDGRNNNKIQYVSADYQTDIWTSDAYNGKNVRKALYFNVDGSSGEHLFHDMQSAKEVFALLDDLPFGADTLGRYFIFLLEGLDESGTESFKSLFSAGYDRSLPRKFPPQKVCNVYLEYDTKRYTGDGKYLWRVSFEVINNDGLAVDYLQYRDNGSAWFTLKEYSGGYRIESISTIYQTYK